MCVICKLCPDNVQVMPNMKAVCLNQGLINILEDKLEMYAFDYT